MNSKKVLNNAKWIIICKIVQSVIQLVVGMLCARFLGPDNYGLINYAASIAAFVTPVMRLGFDATLVRELVESPEKEKEIMGTSLLLNFISSIVCVGSVTLFATFMNMGQGEVILVCFLYSISLCFGAMEMIQYWYQYKLMSKYSSLVALTSYIIVSLYKIFLLVSAKNIYWFALSHSVEYGTIALILIAIYLKKGSGFAFSFNIAKSMLSRSKHYIAASLMLVVIQHTDHIMLTTMVGTEENGYYSAAITTTTVVQFVYMAIVDSFRPLILQNKKDNSPEYELNTTRLYSIILYLALAQSIVFTLLAGLIIKILYGADFSNAVPVLQILSWYLMFSFMGVVRNVWILAEGKQKYLWRINLTGALFNIVFNTILIPFYGAKGAAFASFMTQLFTNFILGFIIKEMRPNNRLILKSLNPVFFFKELRKILNMIVKRKT
ncbi:MAG: flippase [Ruminococcus sp.]|nr:flippase [Ruminococcus sp.]